MTTTPTAPTGTGLPGPVGVLAAAREAVEGLTQTLWAAADPATLVGVVAEVERLRALLAGLQAQVVVEVEATDAAQEQGWVSVGDFLTHAAGGRKGHGTRLLRTARALCADRTATLHALQAGQISPDQAETILTLVGRLPGDRNLREQAERVLIEHAAVLDATDLHQAGRLLAELLDPDGVAAAEERALARHERSAHLGRYLAITHDHLGGVRLTGRGTLEDAAIIKTTLHALTRPRPTTSSPTGDPDCGENRRQTGQAAGQVGRDPRDHGARLWDALVDTCRHAQETPGLLPDQHGAKPRITLTLTYDQLRDGLGVGVGGATLDTGEPLSAAAVRRLACDADLIPAVLGSAAEVLDVGRTQRLVTPGLWKALVIRDRHCAFPGCGRLPLACDAHHLTHWADGGPTSLDNLVLLCRAHHTLLHTSPWQARTNPTDRRPEFRPPPGRRPPPHPPEHQSDNGWIRQMRR